MTDLLTVGQVFAGRYRIERFLAKGGFGAVYVAEQLETELRVAVKVLWPHVLHSTDTVEKFRLEARIAGRVDSEHIVKVFDAGFDEETKMPFLVMELLRGGDLESVIQTSGPLSSDRLVIYFRQIASALDKAHGYVDRHGAKKPIVHRDLKPQNLFLNHRETGEPIVKILDFGIAKVLSESMQVSQDVKGTPLYMAFEQASAGQITPQTDIWALGLIAFFLLTGRCYWKAAHLAESSIAQLFGEILSLPIEPPSSRAGAVGASMTPSVEFDAWFACCVDRDATRRFQTAGEAAVALARVFNTPDTHASPGTFQARVTAPVSQSGVSGTDASLALGHTASPDAKRRSRFLVSLGAFVLAGAAVGTVVGLARHGNSAAPEPSTANATWRPGTLTGYSTQGPSEHVPSAMTPPPASASPSATSVDAGTRNERAPLPAERVVPAQPVKHVLQTQTHGAAPSAPAPPPLHPR